MDLNLAVLIVLTCYWLVMDRRIGLCLVIILYYALFLITELTELDSLFKSNSIELTLATYCIQLSVDALILVLIAVLSVFYQDSVKLFVLYGLIVATSFLLNGFMLYEEVLDLSTIYKLHVIRQDLSIPLDVLFAVLGSALNVRKDNLDNLRSAYDSIYNRFISYHKTLGD